MPGIGMYVEKLEPSCTAGRSMKWYRQLVKQLDSFLKVGHKINIQPKNSIPKKSTLKEMKAYVHIDFYVNVHNSQKLEII
jgi:hypothetical protein